MKMTKTIKKNIKKNIKKAENSDKKSIKARK